MFRIQNYILASKEGHTTLKCHGYTDRMLPSAPSTCCLSQRVFIWYLPSLLNLFIAVLYLAMFY